MVRTRGEGRTWLEGVREPGKRASDRVAAQTRNCELQSRDRLAPDDLTEKEPGE